MPVDPRIAILSPLFEAAVSGDEQDIETLVQEAIAALDKAKPRIKPVANPNKADYSLRGTVIGLSAAQIRQILRFKSNTNMDDAKQRYSWGFAVNGVECALYDWHFSYRNNEFSAIGPAEIFIELFGGEHYTKDRDVHAV